MTVQSKRNYVLTACFIALILAIYSYPAWMTARSTGSKVLPTMSAPDISLYLNISQIKPDGPGRAIDPFYGISVPVSRMGYLKFRSAFILFEAVNRLLGTRLWWTLFLWNLFWWCVLCITAYWFFVRCLPKHGLIEVVFGLGLLMLFNFGVLQNEVSAWLHLPSVRGFYNVELPIIRPFFPQLPLPFVVLYLILQIWALQSRTRWPWLLMALTQLLGFTIFPFALLMMAGTTAVTVLGLAIRKQLSVAWSTIVFYALTCGVMDLLFFLHGTQAARSGAPGNYSLVQIHLSLLPHRIGGMWLLLATLTAIVSLLRTLDASIRWPLIGLGVTNLLLLLGDVVFSETALQMSTHGGYFVHLTMTILLMSVLSTMSLRMAGPRLWSVGLATASLLLIANGFLIARTTYQHFLPENRQIADLTAALESNPPMSGDLVIAPAPLVDDPCAWVPLASQGHVLFCRNAQVLLSPEQNQSVQRFRQALYLYFTNRDDRWVESVLDDPRATTELARLMFLGQLTTDPAQRELAIQAVRNELIPPLRRAETLDPQVRSFFEGYRRIAVIDDADHPYFAKARLESYFQADSEMRYGGVVLRTFHPR